ncbi:MAG: ATP-binding protein, partial [Pseudomonadota bacterium]
MMWSRLVTGAFSEVGRTAPYLAAYWARSRADIAAALKRFHLGFPGPIAWGPLKAASPRAPSLTPGGETQSAMALTDSGWPGAALLTIDRDGIVLDADGEAAALFGAPVTGRALADLCPPDHRAALTHILNDTAARTLDMTSLAEAHDASGTGAPSRRFELRFAALHGAARAVLAIDRTDDARALDKAQAEARLNLDLLADLSHEMRTPLNAVIGFADAMRNETFGPIGAPKYREYADHIAMSGGHLKDLVSSILDLAKLEAAGGEADHRREMTDLGALARNCAAMLSAPAHEAGLTLDVDIDSDLPLSYLNARGVRQIMINLLTNAVKFTSDGGVAVSARRLGDAVSEKDVIEIVVADTGIGMSAEELTRLGARFTSVHGKGVRGTGGAGLGLALAFALAETEGGGLSLASAPGEGVTARLRLPVRAAPARPAAAARP